MYMFFATNQSISDVQIQSIEAYWYEECKEGTAG